MLLLLPQPMVATRSCLRRSRLFQHARKGAFAKERHAQQRLERIGHRRRMVDDAFQSRRGGAVNTGGTALLERQEGKEILEW